jgi:hypothetical protein
MRFASRAFRLAKDPEHPGQNQDACCLDSARGVAAIADGVASGIFSRQWAAILTEAVVSGPPDPGDAASFAAWLAERREEWNRGIDTSQLAWFQKPKLREGAFSTLLWIELEPAGADAGAGPEAWRLRAKAVGDSCLMHLRGGELLGTFPIEKADELKDNPVVIGSVDLGRDDAIEFQSLEEECRPGDLLVLATDAVADWALRLIESGEPPDWEALWDLPETDWQREVKSLRAAGKMRYDDATLLLLRVGEVVDDVDEPEEPEEEYAIGDEEAPAGPPPLGAGPAEGPPGDVDLEPERTASRPPPVPAPAHAEAPPADWRDKLKSATQRMADQVSEGVLWGIGKLHKATESAEEKLRKRREKRKGDSAGGAHGTESDDRQ